MASYTETKRPEIIELEILMEYLTKTYTGDPILLVEIKDFLLNTTDRDKAIIYLRLFGFSMKDISEELGITKEMVRKRLKKIKKRAKSYINL